MSKDFKFYIIDPKDIWNAVYDAEKKRFDLIKDRKHLNTISIEFLSDVIDRGVWKIVSGNPFEEETPSKSNVPGMDADQLIRYKDNLFKALNAFESVGGSVRVVEAHQEFIESASRNGLEITFKKVKK